MNEMAQWSLSLCPTDKIPCICRIMNVIKHCSNLRLRVQICLFWHHKWLCQARFVLDRSFYLPTQRTVANVAHLAIVHLGGQAHLWCQKRQIIKMACNRYKPFTAYHTHTLWLLLYSRLIESQSRYQPFDCLTAKGCDFFNKTMYFLIYCIYFI